jgi:hypothetical protein
LKIGLNRNHGKAAVNAVYGHGESFALIFHFTMSRVYSHHPDLGSIRQSGWQCMSQAAFYSNNVANLARIFLNLHPEILPVRLGQWLFSLVKYF